MKNNILIIIATACLACITACHSGNATRAGKDTAKYHYNAPSNLDTSKTTTTTGDASTIDNSGNGGTKVAKR